MAFILKFEAGLFFPVLLSFISRILSKITVYLRGLEIPEDDVPIV